MKNNKGFTLVEILAAVTILGVISVLAFSGYVKYADYSKKKAYETMANSASVAAEQFIMDNPGAAVETKKVTTGGKERYVIKDSDAPGITFADLVEEGYLDSVVDPEGGRNNDICTGKVTIGLVPAENKGALDRYIFIVDECCNLFKARYTFTYENQPYVKNGETMYKSVYINEKDLNTVVCP